MASPPQDPAGGRLTYGRGVSLGVLSFGLTAVLGVISGIAVARLYGIEVIGEYALAMAPTGAVWLLSTIREQPALLRELAPLGARDPRVTGLFGAVFAFSTALTLVVSLLTAGAAWLLLSGPVERPDLFWPAVASLALSLLFWNPSWNVDTIFNAFRAGNDLLVLRLHQPLVYLGLAIGLAFVAESVWSMIVAWYASWATSLLHRVVVVRKYMLLRLEPDAWRHGRRQLPEMIRFGLKLTPGAMSEGASNEVGTWLLGAFAPVTVVGAYNRAWTLARRLFDLNYRVNEMLFPTLLEKRLARDARGFDVVLMDSLRYVAAGMLLLASVGGGAAAQVMGLYGDGFSQAADAFALLVVLPAAAALAAILTHALLADDRAWTASGAGVARFVVTAGAGAALTSAHGLTGLAAAMLAGGVVQLAIVAWAARTTVAGRLLELWPVRHMIGLIVAYAAGFLAAHEVAGRLPLLPGLVLGLTAGTVAYCAAIAVVAGANDRDRARLRSLRAAIVRRRALAA